MDVNLTGVDPEEAGGAAEELPGERRILLEVTDEDVVQRLGVVDGVEDVGICAQRGQKHPEQSPNLTDRVVLCVAAGRPLTSDLCCRRWWEPGCRSAPCSPAAC